VVVCESPWFFLQRSLLPGFCQPERVAEAEKSRKTASGRRCAWCFVSRKGRLKPEKVEKSPAAIFLWWERRSRRRRASKGSSSESSPAAKNGGGL
jgi:hypothetical protein